jgi:hypothetical protein
MAQKHLPQQIKPVYSLIKPYFKGTGNEASVSEDYFKGKYELYSKQSDYEVFTALLDKCNLLGDSNLFFFWVWYFDAAALTKYFESNEAFKVWNKRNKELVKLKETFSEIKQSYRHYPNELMLKSITFELVTSKGIPKKTKLMAHPLMYNLFLYLEKFVQNEELTVTPKEKNVKTYFIEFILETHPFYCYLKDTHFKSKSKNKVYIFIADFLNTILNKGNNIISWEQIKDIYQKKGKTNIKNK